LSIALEQLRFYKNALKGIEQEVRSKGKELGIKFKRHRTSGIYAYLPDGDRTFFYGWNDANGFVKMYESKRKEDSK
jgi:hypothetical protein